MPIAAPMPRRRCAPTARICSRSSSASASWSTSPSATSRPTSSASRPRCRSILAPVGLLGMQHGDGEIHACRAAQAAGIPFTQSTMSICSIEDIAAAVDKPFWFQLYVMKDRGFIKALIERAIAAKCSALVLTVDLQVIGQRHQDIKNGMTRAAGMVAVETDRFRHQAGLGRRRAARQAPHLRQYRRPHQGHRRISLALALDQLAVRHHAELEGRRVDPQHLAGQADPQGHPRRRGRRGSRRRPARRRWSSPTMAAGSSTARRRRSRCCRRSSMPSARRWRSCSTAASAPART